MNFDQGSQGESRKSAPSAEFKDAQEKVELRVSSEHGDANPGTNADPNHEEGPRSELRVEAAKTSHEETSNHAEAGSQKDAFENVAKTEAAASSDVAEEPLNPPAPAGIASGGKLPRSLWGLLLAILTVAVFLTAVDRAQGILLSLGATFGPFFAFYIWFCIAVVKINNYLRARGASVESTAALVAAAVSPFAIILFIVQFAKLGIGLYLELPYVIPQAVVSVAVLAYWITVQIRWASRLGWFFRTRKLHEQQAETAKTKKVRTLQEEVEQFLVRWKVLFVTIVFFATFPLFLLTGPLYVHFLNRNIRAVFEVQKRDPKAKELPKDKFLIRYRTYAAIELWLRQRFSRNWKFNHTKALLLGLAAPFLIAAGGFAAIWLLSRISPAIGSVFSVPDPGTAAASNVRTIVFMACLFVASAGAIMWRLGRQPTHFEFSPAGFRPLRKSGNRVKEGPLVAWPSIEQVALVTGTKVGDSSIIFSLKDGSTQKLKLSSIESMDDREAILKAIELWAPSLPRTSELVQALQPPMDHSYTELWLQALAAPPERDRLKPLTSGVALKEERYRVKRSLGVGGQGSAYEAVDQLTEESVVLKEFLLPVYVDVSVRKEVLESFENEARLLRQLDHRQIVKLIDFFVEDHRAYLVLEHIEGLSLRDLVDSHGRLPESRVNELARSMCEILEYLHGREPPVVHRDFTPDNLILRSDGLLKLIDFNVAQQLESGATGSVVGKPAYLPPEQFRGMPVTQSDIYALGATLMFLLLGRDPEPISVSHPRKFDESLSESIDAVVATATCEEIGKRYATASQLLSVLKPGLSEMADLKFVIGECTEKIEIRQSEEEEVEPFKSMESGNDLASVTGDAPNTVPASAAEFALAAYTDAAVNTDFIGEDEVGATGGDGSAKVGAEAIFGPKLKRSLSLFDTIVQAACYLAVAIGVTVLISPTALLSFDPDRQYYTHLVDAAQHIQARDYAKAVDESSKAVEIRPDLPKGYWMRSLSFGPDKVKEDQSIVVRRRSDLKKMVTLNFDEADALASIGQASSIDDYELAVNLGRDDISPSWFTSLPVLDELFSLYKNAYLMRSYVEVGKPELALNTLKKSIEINKLFDRRQPELYYGLGAVLNELCHNYGVAQRNLDNARVQGFRFYGKLTPYELHKEAMSHAQEFPQDEKSESAAWSLSEGVGYCSLGYYERSRRALTDLITLKPDFVDGYLWRSDVNYRLGDIKMALADADKSLTLSPNSVRAHYLRALSLLAVERYDEALKEIDLTIAGGEKDTPVVRYVRGRIYLGQGKFKQAIDDLEYSFQNGQAWELIDASAFGEIGALTKSADYESALRKCQEAIARYQSRGEAYHVQGTVYDAMGKKEEARTSFDRAKQLRFKPSPRRSLGDEKTRTFLSPQSWWYTDF